ETADRLGSVAWAQAELWPKQNHLGVSCLFALALVVFINIASGAFVVPWLATHLLGLETPFGLSGWQLLNTTFLATVGTLTWLVVDPLIKAFYFLRVFYGRALVTGEDLRLDLAGVR